MSLFSIVYCILFVLVALIIFLSKKIDRESVLNFGQKKSLLQPRTNMFDRKNYRRPSPSIVDKKILTKLQARVLTVCNFAASVAHNAPGYLQ